MKHIQMRAKALRSLLDEMGDAGIKKHMASAQDMGAGTEVGEHEGMEAGHDGPVHFDMGDMDGDEGAGHGSSVVAKFKKMMKG